MRLGNQMRVGVLPTNSATFSPQKIEEFRSFPRGW